MKIQHLLTGVLILISQALFSQDVTLSGMVLCPDGTQFNSNGVNYIFMTQDSTICCIDSIGIPLDANGNFNYTFTGESQGIVTLWYADYSGNYIGASAYYYPGNTTLVFTLDACEPEEEPCYVDVSYGTDSLVNEVAYVFLNAYNNLIDPVYSWDFGDGTTSSEANPQHEYSETGTYTICVTVTGGGCTASDCIEITVDSDGNGQEGGGMMVQGFTLVVNGNVSSTTDISTTDFAIFPNPISAGKPIFANTSGALLGEISLYSASGVLMERSFVALASGTNALPINTNKLTPGMYFLELREQSGKTHPFKLVY